MPFTTETLPDQPVIITTYEGQLTADELLASQQKIIDITEALGLQQVYAIQDLQQATTNFVDVITNIKAFNVIRKESAAQATTETVLIFVGNNTFVNLISSLFGNQQHGGYRVFKFQDVADALTFIEIDRARVEP